MCAEVTELSWDKRLGKIKRALDHWRERVKSPETVNSGSSLARDDRVHPELPCSQLAWSGLIMGVEHLDASISLIDHQTDRGQPIFPIATYTVLRGALLGSSQAALLLCTGPRAKRINYALRIAREEYRQVVTFRSETVSHAAVSESERQTLIDDDYLGWAQNGIRRIDALLQEMGGSKGKLLDTDLIREAAKVVFRGDDADLLRLALSVEWRLGSGSSHGRLLMNMHRPQEATQDDDGQTLYFGTSKAKVTQQIATVSLVLNEAWRMWDLRKSPQIGPN